MARFRTFACELYPEDAEHLKILEYIKKYYEYAYILHNKDVWEEDRVDDDGITIHKVGDLKKPHYHVVLSFKNPRSLDKLKNELGLKHLETCNFYFYIRYLTHKDYPRKFQYLEEEIITNMELRVHNALKRDYNSQEQDTRILLEYIYSQRNQSYLTLKQLTDYAMENDCLLDLKRNINFYRYFIDDIGYRRI